MKTHYDFIFGLGMACSCSQSLRAAGLQFLSFPYDWLTLSESTPEAYAGDLTRRAAEVADGFSTWFKKDDFTYAATVPSIGKDVYVATRLGLVFNHDFLIGTPFDAAFDEINAKYRRRAERLLDCIRKADRVLVVRVDRPDVDFSTGLDDCRRARQILREAFPSVQFDIVHLACEKGRPFAKLKKETLEDGITRFSFDYRDTSPDAPSYQVAKELTGGLLRNLYSVTDYRTAEEKKSYERKRRLNRYRKVGAKNRMDYLWIKLKAHLGLAKSRP